jgi:hypothetical protein
MNTYTLSLSPDYVSSWGLWEAVRELLQNAIDQKRANSKSEIIFSYDTLEHTLDIGSTHCKLESKTLLMGGGDKRYEDKFIGEHGEGYKLAILVLTRLSYDVVVYNDDVIWLSKFTHSKQYDSHVLTVSEHEAGSPEFGVRFHIRDVSQEDFATIVENYLPGFGGNHILDEQHLRKRIFVGGLFVCRINDLRYGYNFEPGRIKLDRDRRLAPTFEVAYEASKLWAKTRDRRLLYKNMEEGIRDVEYAAGFTSPELSNWITDQYIDQHGETLPVSSQQEMERHRGVAIRLVPQALKNLLRTAHEFIFNRQGTPTERLESFRHQFGQQWGAEAKREFDAILAQSKDWVGPATEDDEATEAEELLVA